jgi:hypothetical protein
VAVGVGGQPPIAVAVGRGLPPCTAAVVFLEIEIELSNFK